jgi:hypothetical protein
MLGPVLIVLAVVVALPVSFMLMGAAVSFLFGWSLTTTAEADVADTPAAELIETNH